MFHPALLFHIAYGIDTQEYFNASTLMLVLYLQIRFKVKKTHWKEV